MKILFFFYKFAHHLRRDERKHIIYNLSFINEKDI